MIWLVIVTTQQALKVCIGKRHFITNLDNTDSLDGDSGSSIDDMKSFMS